MIFFQKKTSPHNHLKHNKNKIDSKNDHWNNIRYSFLLAPNLSQLNQRAHPKPSHSLVHQNSPLGFFYNDFQKYRQQADEAHSKAVNYKRWFPKKVFILCLLFLFLLGLSTGVTVFITHNKGYQSNSSVKEISPIPIDVSSTKGSMTGQRLKNKNLNVKKTTQQQALSSSSGLTAQSLVHKSQQSLQLLDEYMHRLFPYPNALRNSQLTPSSVPVKMSKNPIKSDTQKDQWTYSNLSVNQYIPTEFNGLDQKNFDANQANQKGVYPLKWQSYPIESRTSLSSIAGKFNLDLRTLVQVNHIDLKQWQTLKKINIPNQNGLLIKLTKPMSIQEIANLYSADSKILKTVNHWDNQKISHVFLPGQKVFIPCVATSENILAPVSIPDYYFEYPIQGFILSAYGRQVNPLSHLSSFHNGDLFIQNKQAKNQVKSVSNGSVFYIGYNSIYGNYVIIQMNSDYKVLYAHLGKILVKAHQKIRKKQVIAQLQTTGVNSGQLYFALFYKDQFVNPDHRWI